MSSRSVSPSFAGEPPPPRDSAPRVFAHERRVAGDLDAIESNRSHHRRGSSPILHQGTAILGKSSRRRSLTTFESEHGYPGKGDPMLRRVVAAIAATTLAGALVVWGTQPVASPGGDS